MGLVHGLAERSKTTSGRLAVRSRAMKPEKIQTRNTTIGTYQNNDAGKFFSRKRTLYGFACNLGCYNLAVNQEKHVPHITSTVHHAKCVGSDI
jgi:hypothetical protein